MLFEGLSGKLQEAMKKLRGKGRVTEKDVKEMMREIKLALLEADVNFKVVKDFIGKVSERAVGRKFGKPYARTAVIKLSMKSLSTSWVLQTAR